MSKVYTNPILDTCGASVHNQIMHTKPLKLVLIRHAESERNKALNGSLFLTDPTLLEQVGSVPDHKISITEQGIEQAKQTGEQLVADVGMPDTIIHSGYKRTKQTAEYVLKNIQGDFAVLENLAIREREGGYTHMLLEDDKEKLFPYLQKYWDVVGGLFARPVGGESLMDVIEQRLKPFLKHLEEKHAGETVYLFTHGRVIQCFRFILDQMTWEDMEEFLSGKQNTPENCSVTVYSHKPELGKLTLDVANKVYWKE